MRRHVQDDLNQPYFQATTPTLEMQYCQQVPPGQLLAKIQYNRHQISNRAGYSSQGGKNEYCPLLPMLSMNQTHETGTGRLGILKESNHACPKQHTQTK